MQRKNAALIKQIQKQQVLETLSGFSAESAQAKKCRNSFFYFVKTFWEVVVADQPVYNWHIPYICGILTKMAQRIANNQPKEHDLIINIPPGSTKSLLFNVFLPAWVWIKWPWMKFIKTSYSAALSLEHGELCRDLIRSESYQRHFPNLRIKRDKDTKSNFRMVYFDKKKKMWRLGGNMYSTSVTGTLTGYHAHFLLIDDPIDPYKAYSITEMDNVNRWISQVLPTRKVNKEVSATAMIMQRVETNDPSGKMLDMVEQGLSVKHVCLPADITDDKEKERVSPQSLVKFYNKNLLDPIRMSTKALKELLIKMGLNGYNKQMQQNPDGKEGSMFQARDFKIINGFDRDEILNSIRYWDKAGTTDAGCYTAGVLIHLLIDNTFVIDDVIEGQWAAPEREKEIKQAAKLDGLETQVWVEQEPGSGGKESAENTIRNLAGFCIYADKVTGAKQVRAEPYAIQVENGNVRLLNRQWTKRFVRNHVNFPNSDLKDLVDAAAGAMNKLLEDERPTIRVIG